jgi:hypothetical protein
MHVRFDRDGAVEGSGEGAGDFPLPAPASMKTFRSGKSSTSLCNNRFAFRFWSVWSRKT